MTLGADGATAGAADAEAADRELLEATPLTARRVLYAGDGFERFAAGYRRRNPNAALHEPATAAAGATFDVVVVGPGGRPEEVLAPQRLAPGGTLVMLQPDSAPNPIRQFAAAGLGIVKALRGKAGALWVAQAAADAAGRRLQVELWAYAPVLMDIRTRLPIQQLNTEPRVTARHNLAPFTLPDLPDTTAKVVVVQRPGRSYTAETIQRWLAPTLADGWLPILELDDHPELINRTHGYDDTDQAWTVVRAMAAVQTSTARLGELFAQHNPEVKVFPNAVFDLPPFPEGDRPRRVFYGAISRGPLAVEVARSLAPVVKHFPDLEFVVVGDRAVFDALPTRRKRFEDFLPYERYLALMRTCSVTLSPLAPGDHEEAKSDAKFLDAAQSGALMIASPTVYGEAVQHGVNGLIARGREQWAALLTSALRSQAKRREMARRAWLQAREQRMFADQIAERRDWYLGLWERRAELERRLCERLPGLAEEIARHRREAAARTAGGAA